MRLALALGALTGAMLLAGAAATAGGGCTPADSVHTQATGAAIEISSCKFSPVVLFAPIGATVTWTSRDDHPPHNVHGLGWGMPAGSTIGAGGETRHTFDRPGLYPYQCSLHPGMNGVVVVGDGQLPGASTEDHALVAASSTDRDNAGTPGLMVVAAAFAMTAFVAYTVGRRKASS